MKNTYIQSKKYKNYKFSKGEDVTEKDLKVIKARTSTTYFKDPSYERYMSEEFSSFNSYATLVPEELQYSSGDSFQIGNNLKGGI